MDRLMKRLSRSSFRSSHLNESMDSSDRNSSARNSIISDSDSSTAEESLPPQIPPPLPPRPPPRRRRKQTAVFYSYTTPTLYPVLKTIDDNKPVIRLDIKPAKRPSVPPPIPPRSISFTECSTTKDSLIDQCLIKSNKTTPSEEQIFSNQELIENLTQNLSVMEELNQSLRGQLSQSREENSNVMNELAAIHIERKQLLQLCQEMDRLKDNEWFCSICLDDRQLIASTNRQIVATFCGHIFCMSCVNMALDVEYVCPTCRKPIPQKAPAFHLLYF